MILLFLKSDIYLVPPMEEKQTNYTFESYDAPTVIQNLQVPHFQM